MKRALIIDEPWISKILSVEKTWEMRTRPTKIRGLIGLIRKSSGLIIGQCELIDSPIISMEDLVTFTNFHCIEDITLLTKWRFPWILKDAKLYDIPIPYKHPLGAVIWVKL